MAENKPGQECLNGQKDKQEHPPLPDNASDNNIDLSLANDGQPGKKPVLVAGIGSSAGGLKALTRLLKKLPHDTGMAFILIQHLDPRRKSSLVDILAEVTPMPVLEVRDKTPLHPNCLYVAPPGSAMSMDQGTLSLIAREDLTNQYMPADFFLMSLAGDQGPKAIGVILSGTSTDGSRGLKEIKKAGGLTFAQKPQTAQFEGMPLHAIASGAVDYVLSPEEIALKLTELACSGLSTVGSMESGKLFSDGELNQVLDIVQKTTGTNFSGYRELTIKRRVLRRMIQHRSEKLGDYVDYLRENPAEVRELYQDMLINVTNFFRDPEVFEALKREVFPVLIENRAPQDTIRVWVPGCSTGEEAYSIAIVCVEFLEEAACNFPVQIFATDINDTLIEKARAGVYPAGIQNDVAPGRLSRFFTRVEKGYRISKKIRDICIFARQDMVKEPPFSRLDLISCRNAIIYFGPSLQKRLFPVLHYALREKGFLLLGASESVGIFSNLFNLVDKKHKIFSKKAVPVSFIPEFTNGEYAAAVEKPGWFRRNNLTVALKFDVAEEANRIVLSQYAPAGVIVNGNLEIIQFRGRTGHYLESPPGTPTMELFKMVREGLSMGLHSAINKAGKGTTPVRKENLVVYHNGLTQYVNVDVIPIEAPNGEKFFLILFEKAAWPDQPGEKDAGSAAGVPGQEEKGNAKQQLDKFRHELAAAKEYLLSVTDQYKFANEELRAAYEEIQSSNEELQSMNEELETAKEELQSTNEELVTLNDEAQKRNAELDEISSDLFNLFRCISIPVIMLDNDLKIRRFNPPAEKLFNLIAADIGRPLTNINTNFNNADLEQAILEVTDTLISKEQEGQDRYGRWYSVQIRPFRTMENKIDGVIITYIDIDPIKRLALTEEAREYAEAVVDTVREPLLVLDSDLHVKSANKAFFETFMVTPGETLDRSIFDLGNGQWDIPQLRILLEEILSDNKIFENFEVVHEFPQIGFKKVLVNARRLICPGSRTKLILMAMENKV